MHPWKVKKMKSSDLVDSLLVRPDIWPWQ